MRPYGERDAAVSPGKEFLRRLVEHDLIREDGVRGRLPYEVLMPRNLGTALDAEQERNLLL
jgi:hypothetical protein